MSGVKVSQVGILVAAALGALGCHAHEKLCEGDGCRATDPGSGGAGSSEADPGGAAGSSEAGAGGAAEAPCQRDSACQNESACDGVERCVEGRCETGEALACLHGTQCIEAEGGSCVYTKPSPWLVAIATDKVSGLPLDQIAAGGELLSLAEREVIADVTGFDSWYWSPNGKVALLRSAETQLGSSLKMLRFGAGLPGPAVDVPDVPAWGDYWEAPKFSDDSRYALVFDLFSETYLVDLAENPEPTRIYTDGPPFATSVVARCADQAFWLETDADGQYFVATEVDGETSLRALGPGSVELSPDRRLIARTYDPDEDVVEEGDGIWLHACSADDWSVPFAGAIHPQFSPDSKRLLLDLDRAGLAVVGLDDPEHPESLWSHPDARRRLDFVFTPDSRKLLVDLPNDNDDDVPNCLDLSDPQEPRVTDLGLSMWSSVAALGKSSLLAWSTLEPPSELFWQSLTAENEPKPLQDVAPDTHIETWSFAEDAVLLWQRSGEMTTMSTLTLGQDFAEPQQLASFAGLVSEVLPWPEGHALAVTTQASLVDYRLWWLPIPEPGVEGEPRLLAEGALKASLQPWR